MSSPRGGRAVAGSAWPWPAPTENPGARKGGRRSRARAGTAARYRGRPGPRWLVKLMQRHLFHRTAVPVSRFRSRVLTAPTDDFDVVLPVAGGYPQPLAAAYRITRGPVVDELLAATAMVATRPAPFARCHLVRCRRGGGAGVGQLADCHDQRRNGRLDGDIPLVTGATVAFRCPDAGG
jgi:hypothetical protein